ncbi:MAG: NIPSNAP family protein [Bradyrhizobium sp.]|nr:NIPSNAP family protein [Bradyrhizobium sp.]
MNDGTEIGKIGHRIDSPKYLATRGNLMLYELRTYTVKPGSLGDMVKAASTLARDIRKDDYGKLEGYWLTDIGPLNQVVHLWSYADFSERSRLRGALSKNSRCRGWSSNWEA